MSDSLRPQGLYSPRNPPGQNTGVGSLFPSPGDLHNPGTEPRSPALQADSLPAEPQGKPNTRVGSLFPSPADLPNPGIKPGSPALQVDSLPTELLGKPPKTGNMPPQNNWTSKLWNIHIFKDYLATKRNKLLTCSIRRKNLSYYDERKKTNKITEQTPHNSIYVKVHKMQAKLEWQAADQRPHGDRSKGILGKIGNTEEHKEISGDDKIILILMTA